MAVCRFRPLGGVLNRKLRRRSTVRSRFPMSVSYTFLVYQAPFGSYNRVLDFPFWRNCDFDRLGASETGSDVTSRYSDYVFLFVFCQHFPSILFSFDGVSDFPLAETHDMSISAAKGRTRPEVTSPFDSLTPIFGNWNFSSISHRSKVIRRYRLYLTMTSDSFPLGTQCYQKIGLRLRKIRNLANLYAM
jgi:hypothetical protein